MEIHEPVQRVRPQRGQVAVENEHVPLVAEEVPLGGEDRMPGAALGVLIGESDPLVGLADGAAHLVRLVAHHDDGPGHAGRPRGLDHVAHHRPPGDVVDKLGGLRLHPFPHPRGEDHGAHLTLSRRGRGAPRRAAVDRGRRGHGGGDRPEGLRAR